MTSASSPAPRTIARGRRTRVEGRTAAPFRAAKSGTDREFGLAGSLSFLGSVAVSGQNGDVKRLYILRHAKSSWDDAELADHERPLAPRGERAAAKIAEHVRSEEIAPALVLCSTALRARQTLAALLPVLAGNTDIHLEEDLYGAGPDDVLARVHEVPEAVPSVLLIGHNPTLHELALALTGSEDALERFPTGALASVTFATTWADLAEGEGDLESLVVPKDL
jgi:phosphohistidine phosphatase